jgi:hypothetical protein
VNLIRTHQMDTVHSSRTYDQPNNDYNIPLSSRTPGHNGSIYKRSVDPVAVCPILAGGDARDRGVSRGLPRS